MTCIPFAGGFDYDTSVMTMPQTQLGRFTEAARELETDNDPERFKERLEKAAKHKPANGPE